MPKSKILMGNETPPPMRITDPSTGGIMDMKGNVYSVDSKTGKQTLIKAGPKPKKVTPRPKPKPKPTVVNKQVPIPNDKRNLPGPVMPPPKGGDPIRRKGNLGDKVKSMLAKPKKPIGRGGR